MYLNLLQRKYPSHYTAGFRLGQAATFGLFISFLLGYFQPFQLSASHLGAWYIAFCFAAATTVGMLVLNVLVPALLPAFFEAENWVVGKELAWVVLNFLTIGWLNLLTFLWLYSLPFSWNRLLWFELNTLVIGMLPFTFFVLWQERKQRLHFDQVAQQLNQGLIVSHPTELLPPLAETLIQLHDENIHESLTLSPKDLYYIAASSNYVEVVYQQASQAQRVILRNSLKNIAAQLAEQTDMLRCHKSFLVNLRNVEKCSGNAQGFRLHLADIGKSIPVSRKHNELVKAYFQGNVYPVRRAV